MTIKVVWPSGRTKESRGLSQKHVNDIINTLSKLNEDMPVDGAIKIVVTD